MAIRTIIFPLAFYKAEVAAAEFQTHSNSYTDNNKQLLEFGLLAAFPTHSNSLTDSTRPIITTPIIRMLAFVDSTRFRNNTIRHSES